MLREKTVGVIIFRRNPEIGIQYLTLYLRGDYWNFPKGHTEEGESEIETARREVYEEVGIRDLKFIEGWRQQTQFIYKETHREKHELIRKDLVLYFAETGMSAKIDLPVKSGDGEKINGYAWLDIKMALKYLKFKNLKEILKEADSYIGSLK